MRSVELTDPSSFAGAFAYEHADIPPDQTLTQWRRERAAQARAAKAARRAARRERRRARFALRAAPGWGRAVSRRVEAAR